MKIFTQSIKQ
jgi:citrate synthase